MKKTLLFAILCYSTICIAQNVRGTVTEATTNTPLLGATIVLKNSNDGQNLTATSDEKGLFRFEQVTSGKYSVEITFIGYAKTLVTEVIVKKGSDTEVPVAMQVSNSELKDILVNGQRNDPFSTLQTQYPLGVEQTLRLPAAFNDPARLAMNNPGVTNDNDLGNGLSIRGYSPDALQWRLEGVEIVNPNHLSNASSYFDQATTNAGGTNALSSQLLGTSSLITGGFTGEYNNVISGVMDMRLRNGNSEKHHFTTQTSLVGLDFAAEGPFSKKSKASYLVNYRYSTVGLLLKAGVPLSEEKINFQDLAWNIHVPFAKGGTLKIFGMVGNSHNTFETKKDTIRDQRDLTDVFFKDKLQVYGASYKGQKGLEMVFVHSESAPSLIRNTYSENFKSMIIRKVESGLNTVNSFKVSYTKKTGEKTARRIGLINTSYEFSNKLYTLSLPRLFVDFIRNGKNYSSQFSLSLEKILDLKNIGNSDSEIGFSPKYTFQYYLKNKAKINFSAAVQRKWQNEVISLQGNLSYIKQEDDKKFVLRTYLHTNSDFDPTYYLGSNLYAPSKFDYINSSNRNIAYGIESSFEQSLASHFNYSLVGSLYQNSNSFYNDLYAIKASINKEWLKTNKKFGVSVLSMLNGNHYIGVKNNNINITQPFLNKYYYEYSERFNIGFQNYFRTDLRLYRQRDRKNWSSTLSLDIQNVTNQQNIAFIYYDTYLKKNVTKFQNGLIPILGWRANF